MGLLSSRWLKVGISLALLVLLFRSTNLRALTGQILTARIDFFLLAFIGYLAGQMLSAYKWLLLAQPLGFFRPPRTFVVYYFAGMYLNLFAPSTIVGDLGRGLLLAERKENLGRALQSVLADRISGGVMLIWVSAGGFLLFGPTILPSTLCYGTIAIALFSVVGWWLLPRVVARYVSPQHRLHHAIMRVVAPYQTQTPLLVRASALALVFHLFQLGLLMILARALGFTLPLWYLILFVPLITILSLLPFSFSGIGVREGGYVFFLALIGIGRDEALALGLLWSAVVLGAGLVGGVVLLLSPEARLSFAHIKKMKDE